MSICTFILCVWGGDSRLQKIKTRKQDENIFSVEKKKKKPHDFWPKDYYVSNALNLINGALGLEGVSNVILL